VKNLGPVWDRVFGTRLDYKLTFLISRCPKKSLSQKRIVFGNSDFYLVAWHCIRWQVAAATPFAVSELHGLQEMLHGRGGEEKSPVPDAVGRGRDRRPAPDATGRGVARRGRGGRSLTRLCGGEGRRPAARVVGRGRDRRQAQ
jgi:hypothetical protein